MKAANYKLIKEFRKKIDIKQRKKHNAKDVKTILPPVNFVYGKANRPSTPIKNIINNDYGNKAIMQIKNEYKKYFKQKSLEVFKPPKVVPRFINPKAAEYRRLKENKKNSMDVSLNGDNSGFNNEKPLYKLKMFLSVGSKIAETIKKFKTYHPYKKRKNQATNNESRSGSVIQRVQENHEDFNQKELNEIKGKESKTIDHAPVSSNVLSQNNQ